MEGLASCCSLVLVENGMLAPPTTPPHFSPDVWVAAMRAQFMGAVCCEVGIGAPCTLIG